MKLLRAVEDGLWTPRIDGTTAAGAGTYSSQVGWYARRGRLIHLNWLVQWSAHTGTGNMIIAGLPFAVGNMFVPALHCTGITIPASSLLQARGANSTILLESISLTGSGVTALAIDAAGAIRGSGTYMVA